ncbi:TetR/AcrR family transcriptional regulator [Pseudomonas sp. M30-35]|uniref:TetR/AcrR family transcriptional regulator n=1 Tax=Pseudomonas sp. M30-35 TaxID=1981174 RepID=UPI000B3CFDA2|nr:TetR/AcrR family transcriptional regulator [Pseudomonas sp. M30-35]ARU90205.1 TetR family transcriptional regulator [Pseudomonas sp. M30-35]
MPRAACFDRQVALERAVELFWSRGYYASSMKHIEQALDMRPGSLYATFGSKSGLFMEALDAYVARTGENFRLLLEGSPTVVDGLKGYLRSFVRPCAAKTQMPAQACMLVKTLLEINPEDAELLAKADAVLALVEQRICKALEQAKAAAELHPDVDCSRLARLLQAQMIGLRVFAERDVPDAQVEALADDIANLIDAYRLV